MPEGAGPGAGRGPGELQELRGEVQQMRREMQELREVLKHNWPSRRAIASSSFHPEMTGNESHTRLHAMGGTRCFRLNLSAAGYPSATVAGITLFRLRLPSER